MACTVFPTTYAPTPYDDEIAALNFQLEEIERTTSSSKGKHRADEPQDLELAFAAFQAEIQQHILYIEDARFARSLANALDTDTSMLDEFVGGDIQFQADRELALQLCTDVPDLEAASPNLCSPALSSPNLGGSPDLGFNEFLRALSHGTTAASSVPQAALNASCFITGTVVADTIASRRMTVAVKAEPSNHGTQNTQKTQETLPTKDTSVTTEPQKATVVHNDALQTESCSCCTEEMKVGEMVKVPCGHSYCKRCLKDMFNKSTKNEDLFPPRCCSQHIPLQHIISSMDWDEARQFQIAELAFRTPNKTYCSNPICGSFIFPENVFGEIAQCQTCRKETCIHCKSVGHAGDCPKDTNLQATLATAKEQGWQRCTSCQRVVELKIGCNHIVYVDCLPCFIALLINSDASAGTHSAIFAERSGGHVCANSSLSVIWFDPPK